MSVFNDSRRCRINSIASLYDLKFLLKKANAGLLYGGSALGLTDFERQTISFGVVLIVRDMEIVELALQLYALLGDAGILFDKVDDLLGSGSLEDLLGLRVWHRGMCVVIGER